MKLRRMRIENFKNLSSVELHLNPDINVLTGVNNSGKTTVLEAIALWAECFQRLVKPAGRDSVARGLNKGDYWFGDVHNYIDSSTITSVRSPRFEDIFHGLDTNLTISLEAEVFEDDGAASIPIGFTIRAGRGGLNYDILLKDAKSFDYRRFNSLFAALPQPINVVHASPVAFLPAAEDFETLPKVRARLSARDSTRVLRNRLYQLKKDSPRYNDFLLRLSNVLNERTAPLELFFEGDEARDVELIVRVMVGPRDVKKDLSLLGSGTLQIMEILLGVHEVLPGSMSTPKDLNFVLLDEPDSHIHRDIQRRLVSTLVEQSINCQVFLTTHNESFIRSASPSHIFHLEPGKSGSYHPISRDAAIGRKEGLQPSRQIKVLTALGSESALDFLNALEAERLVLVEGEDDARHIQAIVEKQWSPRRSFSAMYWSFRGIDTLLSQIGVYQKVFKLIKNQRSLWDKASLVFDADDLTEDQRTNVTRGLEQKLTIPVFAWPAYTLEATVLAEPDKLVRVFAEMMRSASAGTVAAPIADLDRLVREELAALATRLRARLDDEVHCRGVFERLKTKREKLLELGVQRNIIESDSVLHPKYLQFAKRLLDQGAVQHMAKKEDVLAIVQKVHETYAVPFDEINYFLRLIEATDFTTRFDSWTDMTRVLTSTR